MSHNKSETLSVEDKKWEPEEIKKWTNRAKNMEEKVSITGKLPDEKKFYLTFFENTLPGFTGFMNSLSDVGGSVTKSVALTHASNALQAAGSGFQIAGVAIAGINFFRIPAIYLGALISKQKVPFTLSRNAKWAYSATVLGLALVALLIPATAGAIGVVLGGLILSISVLSLGKLLYQRLKAKKTLKEAKGLIEVETLYLEDIQEKAATAQEALETLQQRCKDKEINEGEYQNGARLLMEEITTLEKGYELSISKLQAYHNTTVLQEKKLAKMGAATFMDKGVGIGLAALAVTGAALALFFPPVGLGLIAASAGAGVLYLVARVIVPLMAPQLKKLGSGIAAKLGLAQKETATTPSPTLQKAITESQSLLSSAGVLPEGDIQNRVSQDWSDPSGLKSRDKKNALSSDSGIKPIAKDEMDSTGKTELLLTSGLFKAEEELQHGIETLEATKHLDEKIALIAKRRNTREAINFIKGLSRHALDKQIQPLDLASLLDTFDHMPKLMSVLQAAMQEIARGEMKLTVDDRKGLLASKPLLNILQKHGVDMGEALGAHSGVSRDSMFAKPGSQRGIETSNEEDEGEGENPGNATH